MKDRGCSSDHPCTFGRRRDGESGQAPEPGTESRSRSTASDVGNGLRIEGLRRENRFSGAGFKVKSVGFIAGSGAILEDSIEGEAEKAERPCRLSTRGRKRKNVPTHSTLNTQHSTQHPQPPTLNPQP